MRLRTIPLGCLAWPLAVGRGADRPLPVTRRDVLLNDDLANPSVDGPVDVVIDAGAEYVDAASVRAFRMHHAGVTPEDPGDVGTHP